MHFFVYIIVFNLIFFNSKLALAYSDFISYGYKSCVTCHFSSSGSGPLNDYGKALFAVEISSRALTSKNDDQLGESSGFFGQTKLPWWYKPGIKYRGLWYKQDVGSQKSNERWINMQLDFDNTIVFDEDQNLIAVVNAGYVPRPARIAATSTEKPAEWISKSHYVRWQIDQGWFAYMGLFDKFYGLKHSDHTAYNRAAIGLGANDQTHGAALHYETNSVSLALHGFIGNVNQSSDLRQKGFSTTGEYTFDSSVGFGASFLNSESDYKKESRAALHSRIAFAKGRSLLTEIGVKKDDSKTSTQISETAYYSFNQLSLILFRGYNFISSYQFYNSKVNAAETKNNDRLSAGILAFPYQRFETRLEVVNSRVSQAENSSPDQWSLLGQVHLSW
jgi:hypothetical protein